MLHFSVNEIKGKVISRGTVNERRIQLIASPKSPAKREGYGCGITTIPPGHVHEEHAHAASEELIYVLSGEGSGVVGGKQAIPLRPGDVISLEKGEPHQFVNTGRDELRLYWIYSPSGPEVRFLDE
ncbi:Cupin_2 domain-containing protein [Ruminococcaceae bacterium BL-6]|nr:Cupin_2 domain-containing protein [Ruminococcaceae bacterium BL-6]